MAVLLLPGDELGIHRQSGHAYAKTGPIWAILGENCWAILCRFCIRTRLEWARTEM